VADLTAEVEKLKAEKEEIMGNLKTIVQCTDKLKETVREFVSTQALSDE
jgi:hypothetical protein